MTTTGKGARKRFGTRVAAKRSKTRRDRRKTFGHLPVSVARGNAEAFNAQAVMPSVAKPGRRLLPDVA